MVWPWSGKATVLRCWGDPSSSQVWTIQRPQAGMAESTKHQRWCTLLCLGAPSSLWKAPLCYWCLTGISGQWVLSCEVPWGPQNDAAWLPGFWHYPRGMWRPPALPGLQAWLLGIQGLKYVKILGLCECLRSCSAKAPHSSVCQTQASGGMSSWGDLLIHRLERSMREQMVLQDQSLTAFLGWAWGFPWLCVGCHLTLVFFVLHGPNCFPNQSQCKNLNISVEGAVFTRSFCSSPWVPCSAAASNRASWPFSLFSFSEKNTKVFGTRGTIYLNDFNFL